MINIDTYNTLKAGDIIELVDFNYALNAIPSYFYDEDYKVGYEQIASHKVKIKISKSMKLDSRYSQVVWVETIIDGTDVCGIMIPSEFIKCIIYSQNNLNTFDVQIADSNKLNNLIKY